MNILNSDSRLLAVRQKIKDFIMTTYGMTQSEIVEFDETIGIGSYLFFPNIKALINFIPTYCQPAPTSDRNKPFEMSMRLHDIDIKVCHINDSDFNTLIKESTLLKRIAHFMSIEKTLNPIEVSADKCIIRTITKDKFIMFMKRNSLGVYNNNDIFYGMYTKDAASHLVAVITGKMPKIKGKAVTFNSYTIDKHIILKGGFGKFIQYLSNGYPSLRYIEDVKFLNLNSEYLAHAKLQCLGIIPATTIAFSDTHSYNYDSLNCTNIERVVNMVEYPYNKQDTMLMNLVRNNYKFTHNAGAIMFELQK